MKTLVAILCFASSLYAGTYYVTPAGSAPWSGAGNCTAIGTPCSLSTANTNAVAGDIVNLRGNAGTYTASNFVGAIQPSNNGSAGNYITFQSYQSENATITAAGGNFSYGVYFGISTASSYIKVIGITFQNLKNFGYIINGSNHIELSNNIFIDTVAGLNGLYVSGGANANWVTHIWVHGNQFSGVNSNTNGCTDGGGDLMDVGDPYGSYPSNTDSLNNYITIENNLVYHAAHGFDNYGEYQVIKNNVFHNEPWSSGCPTGSQTWPDTKTGICTGSGTPWQFCNGNPGTVQPYTNASYVGLFGHRDFQITDDYNRTTLHDLVEGNRAGYAGANQGNDGADNFDLAAPGNIVRENFFYGAMQSGLMFKYHAGGALGGGNNGGTNNRVYNNTFYSNGLGYAPYYNNNTSCPGASSVCPDAIANISLQADISGVGNVVVNNLMYLAGSVTQFKGGNVVGYDTSDRGNDPIYPYVASMTNNWCTITGQSGCSAFGDPKFTNPDITDPTSTTLPDLSLQATSSAIDGGTSLTTTSNSGSGSTSLTSSDCSYFQDGTGGADMTHGVTLFPDWIAVGTVSNIVQISAITYGTFPACTMTLASGLTWSSSAPIWLYKNSSGTRVLYGSAPDYGASEFAGAPATGPVLSGVKISGGVIQ